jgi:hypothetical protein
VGEEVPVLEVEAGLGKGILDRLHRGGRSGSDRVVKRPEDAILSWLDP